MRGMAPRSTSGYDIFHDKANEVTYKRVLPGQFVIHLRSFQGGFAHSAIEGICSPAYTVFGFTNKNTDNDIFWKYIFASERFIQSLVSVTYGIRDGRSISYEEFLKMSFRTPKKDEQTKIATFLLSLDSAITLHQRKCDALIKVKKSMLQKMFPKNGKSKPEVRFAGFTDDWEQRKLGEFCHITTGKLDANAMNQNGKYDFYTSGIQKFKIDIPAFEGPSITIAGNGATVGYMHLADGKFNAYQRTYVLSDFSSDRLFFYFAIGKNLPSKIAAEARTGNIPYIVMDMLTDLELKVPNPYEQQKIGTFFRTLDSAITLHQREVEKLTKLKKALLSKMFI